MDRPNPPFDASLNRRLDSWKEIAAFFGRDERTVRRWEKDRSLPVHRLPGKPRGSVYTYTSELSQWLASPHFPQAEKKEEAPHLAADPHAPAPIAIGRRSRKAPSQFALVALAAVTVVVIFAASLIRSHNSAPPTRPGAAAHAMPSPEAVDFYLRGRYEWDRRTPESLAKAVDFFTQAIVRDPNYAQAYAGLADSYNLLREYSTMPDSEAYPRAIAAARKAVELDDSLAAAHSALAFASFYWSWDFAGAENEFKRAIELDPNNATAHHWYGTALLHLGRFKEALAELDRARRLDPASASIVADHALLLFQMGKTREAIAQLREIETLDPMFLSPHRYLAEFAILRQDPVTFLAESRQYVQLLRNPVEQEVLKAAEAGFKAGGYARMLEELWRAQERFYRRGEFSGFELAETCAVTGRKRKALAYLRSEIDSHHPEAVGVGVDLFFVSLRDEPEFHDLGRRVGLPAMKD
jgi:Tfp pilus assembly protein PilF